MDILAHLLLGWVLLPLLLLGVRNWSARQEKPQEPAWDEPYNQAAENARYEKALLLLFSLIGLTLLLYLRH